MPAPYALGIDVGTAYTAAAVYSAGRVEVLTLSHAAQIIPTAVFVGEEGFMVGEGALHRLPTEPTRVATNFKRRVGDTTPLVLGGHPVSPEMLLAKVMASVMERAMQQQGGPPAAVALTHPANWGPYKREVFGQALAMAGLAHAVTLSEPEAAALAYARVEEVSPGAVLAVYDFGGGTFDAAVVRREHEGFSVLGAPTGVERLGGIDIDAAVLSHVLDVAALDTDAAPGDTRMINALAALQQACVVAKESLSSDTAASIPIFVPGASVDTVRLTRAELEVLIEPLLRESLAALRRALESAAVTPEELHAVLLVGGSSRIPRVRQMVATEFGRPVALDAHSKHPVAIGAAWAASRALESQAVGDPPPPPPEGQRGTPERKPRPKWPLLLAAAAMALLVGGVAAFMLRPNSGGSDGSDGGGTDSGGDDFEAAAISFVESWEEGDYDAMLDVADEDVADLFIEMPFPDPAPELEECSEQVGGETLCAFPVEVDTIIFELDSEEPRVVAGYLDDSDSIYYLITGEFVEAWKDGNEDRLFDLALATEAEKFVGTPHPEFADFTFEECTDNVDLSSACRFGGQEGYTLVLSTAILDDRGYAIVFAGAYDGDGNEVTIADFPRD